MAFNIYNFSELSKTDHVTSEVTCHGLGWYLELQPWGSDKSAAAGDEYTSVYLVAAAPSGQEVIFTFRLGGKTPTTRKQRKFVEGQVVWGYENFMKRSEVIAALDSFGTATVYVDLQMVTARRHENIWRPPNTFQDKMIGLYETNKGVDVTFAVGDDEVRAHKFVISLQCPALFDIVTEHEGEAIPIETDGDLFDIMIRFMYLHRIPCDFDVKEQGLDLLKLANRFAYSDLAMFLEAEIVESGMLVVDNAAQMLLFADGNSCALLKEAAVDVMIGHPKEVTETGGWKLLKESNELLLEFLERQSGALASDECNHVNVSGMRKRLAERKLDADGTKEMMLKRLKAGDGKCE